MNGKASCWKKITHKSTAKVCLLVSSTSFLHFFLIQYLHEVSLSSSNENLAHLWKHLIKWYEISIERLKHILEPILDLFDVNFSERWKSFSTRWYKIEFKCFSCASLAINFPLLITWENFENYVKFLILETIIF